MASVAITTSGSRNCKGTSSVFNEIATDVDAELKQKTVQKKINELENDKQSICHSE